MLKKVNNNMNLILFKIYCNSKILKYQNNGNMIVLMKMKIHKLCYRQLKVYFQINNFNMIHYNQIKMVIQLQYY